MHWHPCLEKKIQYNNNGEKKKDKKKRVSRFFQQSHSTVWKVTFIFAKREEREDSPVALRIAAPSAPSRNACECSCPAALWGCRARGSTHTGAGAQDTAHRECHTQDTTHTGSATLRTPYTPGVPHSGHRTHRECHTQDTGSATLRTSCTSGVPHSGHTGAAAVCRARAAAGAVRAEPLLYPVLPCPGYARR